jgi:hypothetical protein
MPTLPINDVIRKSRAIDQSEGTRIARHFMELEQVTQ